MVIDRRRGERVHVAIRARIRINVTCEGELVNLSESGALLRVPRPHQPDRQVTLAIDTHEPLHLAARVVRSLPVVPDPGANAGVPGYEVAITFLDQGPTTTSAIRKVIAIGHPIPMG